MRTQRNKDHQSHYPPAPPQADSALRVSPRSYEEWLNHPPRLQTQRRQPPAQAVARSHAGRFEIDGVREVHVDSGANP